MVVGVVGKPINCVLGAPLSYNGSDSDFSSLPLDNKIRIGVLSGYGGCIAICNYYGFQIKWKADKSDAQYRIGENNNWSGWKSF